MYTKEDIRQACLPVIGDGEALKQILHNLGEKNVFEVGDIVIFVRGGTNYQVTREGCVVDLEVGTKMRVMEIKDGRNYVCKDWLGGVIQLEESMLRIATKEETDTFYKAQLQFIRSKIVPFLNFFHMRQMRNQLKDEQSIKTMDAIIEKDEKSCLKNIDEIKKLW